MISIEVVSHDLVRTLSELLPDQCVNEPIELWEAGEWGLGLEYLADYLAQYYIPLGRADREQLIALAHEKGVAPRVTSGLRWCPDADSASRPWQVVEDTDFGLDITVELDTEISEGHPLFGRELTPMLVCESCDDVLALVDWGLSQEYTIAVVHPTWSRRGEQPPWPKSEVFTSSDEALDRFVHDSE